MPGGLDGRGGEAALVEVLSGLQLAVQVKDLVVENSSYITPGHDQECTPRLFIINRPLAKQTFCDFSNNS